MSQIRFTSLGSLLGSFPRSTADGGTAVDLQTGSALLALFLKSASTATPPSNPANEDAYLVPTGASGDWTDNVGSVAVWLGVWTFLLPMNGWRVYVSDTNSFMLLINGAWLNMFTLPATIPTITGSKGSNAALTSLLTHLATLGLIVDGTS